MADASPQQTDPNSARHAMLRVAALLLISALGVVWSKLSVVTGFLALVVGLSLPRLSGPAKLRAWGMLWLAVACSTVGFFRFVLDEAIPGVIAGGQAAVSKHTVAFLRTIVTAQDKLRQAATMDHDGDGIGSAARLSELSGLSPLRNGATLEIPALALKPEQLLTGKAESDETAVAPAPGVRELVANGAYLFQLCLPTPDGGFSADRNAKIDEERAERHYLLYAWPRSGDPGAPSDVYFSDEHEALAVFDDQRALFRGTLNPPDCNAAQAGSPTASLFRAWKDKQPRTTLPGDHQQGR